MVGLEEALPSMLPSALVWALFALSVRGVLPRRPIGSADPPPMTQLPGPPAAKIPGDDARWRGEGEGVGASPAICLIRESSDSWKAVMTTLCILRLTACWMFPAAAGKGKSMSGDEDPI